MRANNRTAITPPSRNRFTAHHDTLDYSRLQTLVRFDWMDCWTILDFTKCYTTFHQRRQKQDVLFSVLFSASESGTLRKSIYRGCVSCIAYGAQRDRHQTHRGENEGWRPPKKKNVALTNIRCHENVTHHDAASARGHGREASPATHEVSY